MACEYCDCTSGHDSRCPNYVPPKVRHFCSICCTGIYNREKYIENLDGKYAHYDCLTDLSCRAMIKWLGGEVKTMVDDDGEDY